MSDFTNNAYIWAPVEETPNLAKPGDTIDTVFQQDEVARKNTEMLMGVAVLGLLVFMFIRR